MATFRPVNDDHAVTNVIFQLRLDEIVEPDVLNEAAATDPGWKSTLPAVLQIPPIQMSVGGQTYDVPGLQAAIVKPDARPIWSLRLQGQEITVECSAYTRWKAVWEQARTYLTQAFALLAKHQTDAHIMEVRLQVVDRFLTDDDTYAAEELFRRGYVPNFHLEKGGLWHSNTGWFDDGHPFRLLHSLNVQAAGKRSSDGTNHGPYAFTITHMQTASSPGDFVAPERIDEIVERLHESNKAILKGLVTDTMLKQIGMAADA